MIDKPVEIFGEDDARLFQCDDKDLKAKAIRNSIIPRLLEIVRECVSEVRRVYGIDALDVSTLCWSPHSAESRGRGYSCDFRSASAGLEVKRIKGRPMRIIELRLALSRRGLWPVLYFRRGKLGDEVTRAISDFVARHEVEILSLIVSVAGELFISKERNSPCLVDWFPLSKSISAITTFRDFEMRVYGLLFASPIDTRKKDRIVAMFANMFPLYWALAEIGEGREPSVFSELVCTAQEYRRRLAVEWGKQSANGDNCSPDGVDAAERVAESRSKVPVGRRWQVFERDNWRCVSCGRGAEDGVILEVDHILPRSKGGKDTLDNYQTLCRDCNIGKSNKSQKDLRKKNVMLECDGNHQSHF